MVGLLERFFRVLVEKYARGWAAGWALRVRAGWLTGDYQGRSVWVGVGAGITGALLWHPGGELCRWVSAWANRRLAVGEAFVLRVLLNAVLQHSAGVCFAGFRQLSKQARQAVCG